MPTVSVQVVTYNSEKDIKRCLESVRSQSYPIQQVTVIDNFSVDQTMLIVESFKNVQIIHNNDNNGFAGGHNQGINHSISDYLLILNPDVFLHKDYIKNIIFEMEQDKCIGMATGKLYRVYSQRILDSTGIMIKKNRRAYDRGSGEVDHGQFDHLQDVFGVSGAAAVYRREMIEDISIQGQFFDETFFAYKEDVDVSWRSQLLGWKSRFFPNAIAEHSRGWHEEKKRSDVSLDIRQRSYINRYYYLLKNDRISRFILHFPIIMAYEVLNFSYVLLIEKELLVVWKSFISEYKTMLEKRKTIMQKRKVSNKQLYSYFKGLW